MPSRRTLLQTAAWAAALGAGSGVGTAATVPAVGHPSRLIFGEVVWWVTSGDRVQLPEDGTGLLQAVILVGQRDLTGIKTGFT